MLSCREALKYPAPQQPDTQLIHVVAAAIIDNRGHILIQQRPKDKSFAGQWEFPGGKMEKGETPEYALMRELKEELNIETRPCCFSAIAVASHSYEDNKHMLMPLFAVRVWNGTPTPQENQVLNWVAPMDLYQYDLLEADKPLIPLITEIL